MKGRIFLALAACGLAACASRGNPIPPRDGGGIAFAREWKRCRFADDALLPEAVNGSFRDGWSLSGGRVLIHRSGALNEFAPGHFTCTSSIELRNRTERTTAPSILDRDIIKEPGLNQFAVFEDPINGDILVVERRNGGPERGVWFQSHAAPAVFELPVRETQAYGEWYPILGIKDGRLHIRVDGLRYAIPVNALPVARETFTIG